MNLCKVGNQTSSQDPHAVNSRVFVGNLNTFQVNKIDVEKVFQRYGRIVGISMHKGYAFVQFASPFDARSACLGEDGRTISGQIIDVNMVSEPKPHQGKTKTQNKKLSDSSSDIVPSPSPGSTDGSDQGGPESLVNATTRKRARSCQQDKDPSKDSNDISSLKTYDIPDILICGNCKEMFTNLQDIVDHKKNYCKLRFACKCGPRISSGKDNQNAPISELKASQEVELSNGVSLLCSSCQKSFGDPLKLLVHVQECHSVQIFEETESFNHYDNEFNPENSLRHEI